MTSNTCNNAKNGSRRDENGKKGSGNIIVVILTSNTCRSADNNHDITAHRHATPLTQLPSHSRVQASPCLVVLTGSSLRNHLICFLKVLSYNSLLVASHCMPLALIGARIALASHYHIHEQPTQHSNKSKLFF